MKTRLALIISVIGLVLSGALAMPAAAGAAQARPSHGLAGGSGQYCTATALPAGDASQPAVTCYSSFAAQIAAITGGRLRLPASASPRTVSIGRINAAASASPNAVYVLSIDFKNVNYGPPELSWTQSSQCGSFQASSMPSGWNDVVSSIATYSGCAVTEYKNVNFGGATFSVGRNSQAPNLGSFNDSTSSEKWCTAKPC